MAKRKTNEKKLCEKLTFRSVPTPRATRIADCPPCQPHVAAVPLLIERCRHARERGHGMARDVRARVRARRYALMHAAPWHRGWILNLVGPTDGIKASLCQAESIIHDSASTKATTQYTKRNKITSLQVEHNKFT